MQGGGGERMTDDAVEEMLDKVVKLLAYISDKDLFAEFYRKRLSRRLLAERSASDDHERAVLTRLKQQCGAQFTSKVGALICRRMLPSNLKSAAFHMHESCEALGAVQTVFTHPCLTASLGGVW